MESCIQSIKTAGDRILEILVVDDGSTDDTLQTAQNLSEIYPELRILHTENHGIYTARKSGIAAARGKYIAFIDVDDRYCQNALNILTELLEKTNADIAIGKCISINSYDEEPPAAETCITMKEFPAAEIWPRIMRWKTQEYICYCVNRLYKKNVLEDLIEADHISQGEDVLITCQVFQKAKKVVETSQTVYLYYQNENSITHKYFSQHDLELIRVWDTICELMKDNPDVYYMAQINRWRTDFTLICRLVLADDRELENAFAENLQGWRNSLREHYGEIMRARSMPVNRLLVITCLRFAFTPTKLLMQTAQAIRQGKKR